MGKVSRLPLIATVVYKFPLELIVVDLWEPSPTYSINGHRFMFLLVDAHTKYTWAICSKIKVMFNPPF